MFPFLGKIGSPLCTGALNGTAWCWLQHTIPVMKCFLAVTIWMLLPRSQFTLENKCPCHVHPLLPSMSYHPPPSHPLSNFPFLLPFFLLCSFPSFSLMACHPALHRSWGKWLWNWFCGLSGAPQQALSPAEKAVLEQKLTSIEEEPLWRYVCNINAIILLAINIFLWGYFA